ncbi:type IV pilus minor subunit PilV2 (plasmid) [Pseudomonas fluorescens A506]|nr:type IV pilus minor subunit PilV2 [Pseudomonas fluorescens A506]
MKTRRINGMKNQRGFGALETLIVLAVAVTAAIGASQAYSIYVDRQSNQAASEHMSIVADASTLYIKDNYATVLASASPSSPASITINMLRATGYLPASFSDKNAYGQDYSILALAPSPGKLQTLIVTRNGDPIKEMYLIDIAKRIGAKGGYISQVSTGTATGSFAGWSTPLAPYGVSPGVGHLATALFVEESALVNDYLYRSAVPGQPQLNRMNTAIDMSGNNLNNVGTLNANAANVTGTVQANTTNTAGETYTGGWFRARGDGLVYSEKWGGGWYMQDPTWLRSYGDKNVSTGGEMRAGKLVSDGRTQVGEYLQLDGLAVDGNDCSPNGLWGRDAKGPLFCGEGKWKKPGGWEFQLIQGTCQAPYKGSLTCPLGDTSWKSCSLTGAFGIGDSETGYIYRNTNGWYLATSRLTWPGLFYWSCFK